MSCLIPLKLYLGCNLKCAGFTSDEVLWYSLMFSKVSSHNMKDESRGFVNPESTPCVMQGSKSESRLLNELECSWGDLLICLKLPLFASTPK